LYEKVFSYPSNSVPLYVTIHNLQHQKHFTWTI